MVSGCSTAALARECPSATCSATRRRCFPTFPIALCCAVAPVPPSRAAPRARSISADQSHVHWTDWEVLSLEGAVEPECMYFERSQYEAVVTEAMRRVPVELREPHESAQSWERVVRPGGPGEAQVQ